QDIAKKDPEYAQYAGGDYDTALKRAKINTLLEAGLIPSRLKPIVNLYLLYLDKKRKAFFGSMKGEITQLGLLLGEDTEEENVT
ncbi:unnamed protein product, partial [marine sediment metagenome]